MHDGKKSIQWIDMEYEVIWMKVFDDLKEEKPGIRMDL
jgi:hypothetical protein